MTTHQSAYVPTIATPFSSRGEPSVEKVGRYTLVAELASGGMATVHLARFHGEAGFERTVVVKRLHPQFAKDPDFVCMFLDEARLASRVRHPNVVSVYDVVAHRGELMLAMDYVHGASLSHLTRVTEGTPPPLPVTLGLARDLLAGLHAAHEIRDAHGEPMHIVHRDVSPQNLMVGDDGVGRVVDFGIASATARLHTTAEGQVKGKLSYMAPEQIRDMNPDRRVDVFAAGVVLWELATGRRFVEGEPQYRIGFILAGAFKKPSYWNPALPPSFDEVVMKALTLSPDERFQTAEEFSRALAKVATPAAAFEVATWVQTLVGPFLHNRALLARSAERRNIPSVERDREVPVGSEDETVQDDSSIRRVQWLSVRRPPATASTGVESLSEVGRRTARGFPRAVVIALTTIALAGGMLYMQTSDPDGRPSPLVSRNATKPVQLASADRPPPVASPNYFDPASATTPMTVPGRDSVTKRRSNPASKPLDASVSRKRASKPASPSSETGSVSIGTTLPKEVVAPLVQHERCAPPYVLLAGGIKKYKAECL